MRQINYIVIHCTAGSQSQTTESIKAHWRKLGWKKFGYHHLINEDGTIENITPISEVSNGVAGYNSTSIHISYKGGVKDGKPFDNRTEAQKKSIENLVKEYRLKFPKAKVVGHRDFSPDKNRDGVVSPNEWLKSCPSFSVSEWLKQIGLIPNAKPLKIVKTVRSNGSNVNVRKEPNTTSEVIFSAPIGTSFIQLKVVDNWAYGSINEKIIGWVRNDFLK